MSARKSPLYTAFGILVGLIILAGGAAKFYRGISGLGQEKNDPRVSKLLGEVDAEVDLANQEANAVVPAFQQLLTDFDNLGLEKFRAEQRDASDNLIQRYESICQRLGTGSSKAIEATKMVTNAKLIEFLTVRAKSFDLLINANKHNVAIIRTLLDPAVVDADSIVATVQAEAESRAVDEKAANEATTASNALLQELQAAK